MYRYSCLILLVVGCSGQNIPGPPLSGNSVDGQGKNVPVLGPQGKIERECKPYDLTCVRRYFEEHSYCKPTVGKVPEPLYRSLSNQFYASVNITETNFNIEMKGLNQGRIEEFYVNKETDKLVLGIEFRGLTISAKDVFFRYHRRGKEAIITHGYARITFKSLFITVTIPQVDNLRLDKADIFAYSDDFIPEIDVDPKLGESSDPSVPKRFATFLSNVPTRVKEYLLTEGVYYAATYIQHVICDFGLKLL